MDPSEPTTANDRIDEALRAEPPVEGATLEGWVAFSEWKTPEGESRLVLLGRPEENPTQLKGYVHSGLLNMAWGTYRPPVTERSA